MARVELAPVITDDFDRVLDDLLSRGTSEAAERVQEITRAIDVLESNPMIGRPASHGRRELIIGQRGGVHVALYRYIPEVETVLILAIRRQREAGYKHD